MTSFRTTLDAVALKAFIANLVPGGRRAVQDTIDSIKEDIETAMRLPKSGRVYGDHQASAPGDAPAVEEGDLIGSLVAEMIGDMEGEVRAEDPKAAMLEFGTLNGDGSTRIAPRPSMQPAAEANRLAFHDRVEDLLNGR